jgi:RNA polymerase sigma factor (sigma-70 family)
MSFRDVVDLADTATSPSQNADRNAARDQLNATLARLSERHRAVIRLRVWDRMSFRQIGVSFDTSEDAARMLYGRAIARLHELMRPGHASR